MFRKRTISGLKGGLIIFLLVNAAFLLSGCKTTQGLKGEELSTQEPPQSDSIDAEKISPATPPASDTKGAEAVVRSLEKTVRSKTVSGDTSDEASNPRSNYLIPLKLNQEDESQPIPLPTRNLSRTATRSPASSYNFPADMTKDIENPDETVEVKFNFDAESIVNVVQMFSLTLGFQYYIDAGVSGSVTMTIDTEMTRREAWELFEHILWIAGAYGSSNYGFINVLPFAKMPQERRIFAKHDPIPNVHVEIIKLFNTTAADIAGLIKPFMTAGATASPIQYLNSLLIVEAPPNMPKLRELIEKLDVMGERNWPQTSISCSFVEPEIVIEELQKVLPILGFPVTIGEGGDGRSIKLAVLERLGIVLASAPTVEVLTEIERWVRILDRQDSIEEERIFFYDVKYNKAEDLSDSVSVFFSSSSSTTSRRSGRSSGSDTATPRQSTGNQSGQQANASRSTTRRSSSNDEKPATVFDVPVTILADGGHNRLVIRTTPRAYAMLEALLQRLDTPPLQVLIQATIAEITLDKNTEFGFRYAAVKEIGDRNLNIDYSPGTVTGTPLYDFTLSKEVGAVGALSDAGDMLSFIQAVAGETNTKILNSPQIIAISDEEASINVGDSIPIASRVEDGGSSSIDNNFTDIQYQDTGIILTVTPHITAKKLVTLDLRQEVSSATETDSSIQTLQVSPTIQTRTIETSMIVEDGSTLLMGGIIRTVKEESERGLPFVKDIPYIGKLFSFSRDNITRTELLILISVTVIDLETDTDKLFSNYQAAINAIEEEYEDRPNKVLNR